MILVAFETQAAAAFVVRRAFDPGQPGAQASTALQTQLPGTIRISDGPARLQRGAIHIDQACDRRGMAHAHVERRPVPDGQPHVLADGGVRGAVVLVAAAGEAESSVEADAVAAVVGVFARSSRGRSVIPHAVATELWHIAFEVWPTHLVFAAIRLPLAEVAAAWIVDAGADGDPLAAPDLERGLDLLAILKFTAVGVVDAATEAAGGGLHKTASASAKDIFVACRASETAAHRGPAREAQSVLNLGIHVPKAGLSGPTVAVP